MKPYIVVFVTLVAVAIILVMNKLIHKKAFDVAVKSNLNSNVKAFLAMIRWSENKAAKVDSDRYRTMYGGRFFANFSDHPYITKEWLGAKLPDSYCRDAGLSSGCITTAAGGYQFISSTWRRMRDKLGLEDFSANSQDLAAIALISERGALGLVENGEFSKAVNILKAEWASLPGSGVGQPTNSFLAVQNNYLNNGGKIIS